MHTCDMRRKAGEAGGRAACPILIDQDGRVQRLAPAAIAVRDFVRQYPECLPLTDYTPVCSRLETAGGAVTLLLVGPLGELALIGPPAAAIALCALDYTGLEDAVADANGDQMALYSRMGKGTRLNRMAFTASVGLNLDLGRALVMTLNDAPADVAGNIAVARLTLHPFGLAANVAPAGGECRIVCPEPLHPRPVRPDPAARKTFYAAMEELQGGLSRQLERFCDRLAPHDIRPVFGRAMGLVWQGGTRPVALARISPDGRVTTDAEAAQLSPTAAVLAHTYVETLGVALNYPVSRRIETWQLLDPAGGLPNIRRMAPLFDIWAETLGRLVTSLGLAME